MRIGMILDKTFPPDPRVENEATTLINAGHRVFLFCLKYNDEVDSEIINGIHISRYHTNKFEYKSSALAYTLPLYGFLMAKKIVHFIKDNEIEAIHIHDMVIAEAVFKANQNFNLPVVLDLHENRPEIMRLYPHLRKFPGKQLISIDKWKRKEEEFIDKADRVLVVTEEAKEEIIKRIPIDKRKIRVVTNTVKKSFYTDYSVNEHIINDYKDNFVLLYLGDTGLRRGLGSVIESIEILKSKIKNIKLVIVGQNTSDYILKNQVRDYGLEDHIDFKGWQEVKTFPSYIMTSDICISPLHRNLHHDTTYANKIFQYMSFAKPVLVSDSIAQKKLVEKTKSGLVHKEKDAEDFANKVLELYQDPDWREELGRNGKKFIEDEFVWEKVSGNLVEVYKNLEKV